MSLGKRWRATLSAKEKADEAARREAERRKVLDPIPSLVETAINEGKGWVEVYGYVSQDDVAGGDVDALWH